MEMDTPACFHESEDQELEDLTQWPGQEEEADLRISKELSQKQRAEVEELLARHEQVFSDAPGITSVAEMVIETGEAAPVTSHHYRIPKAREDIVKEEVAAMLRSGLIETSRSPWSSPMLLVPKKDGTFRPVVDYRKLNRVTEQDPFPMPRIDELIDNLAGADYITTLDLTKGYWQVPMERESRRKTAFVTPFGKYEFKVMPFGLAGAPATFQRMMNRIFGDISERVAAYIDDVVIFSRTWEAHLEHLGEALDRLKEAGLKVKKRKCQIAMQSCPFLGHVVGRGQVRPELSKIQAIQEFARPQTKRDVRAFMGLASYYRKFVKDFASIAAPLTDLTKKECSDKVIWESQHQQAFEALRRAMSEEPVLQGPDYQKEFVLQTDASNVGIGAVLCQFDDEDNDKPIAYFSRKLLSRERNFSAVDKECLAIVDAVRHFEIYLTGVPFRVITDHSCLRYLDNMKDVGGRLTRWSLRLQPFSFVIQHRPGRENGNADGLSRQAWGEPEENVQAEGTFTPNRPGKEGGSVVARRPHRDTEPQQASKKPSRKPKEDVPE